MGMCMGLMGNGPPAESRALEVRCGVKKQGDARKVYVHMLNGYVVRSPDRNRRSADRFSLLSTLVAVERCLCCIVENYQTPEVRDVERVSSKAVY